MGKCEGAVKGDEVAVKFHRCGVLSGEQALSQGGREGEGSSSDKAEWKRVLLYLHPVVPVPLSLTLTSLLPSVPPLLIS